MGRKTVKIVALVKEVNFMLATSACPKETREGMITVLESALMMTGNYRGFRYLSETEVPVFEKPGIRLNDEALRSDDATAKFKDTDHTRVVYFQ